jgi:hypothetical protein
MVHVFVIHHRSIVVMSITIVLVKDEVCRRIAE